MQTKTSHKNTKTLWDNPIAMEKEEILFTQRKHWIVLVPLIFSLAFMSIFFLIGMNVLLALISVPFFLSVILSLLVLSVTATLLVKVITEWYFAVYVLTNRRMLEITYTPMTSYILNDVLLDQVRCTEIDTETNGLIFKYLDIGDITITFDRPTHKEAFVMRSIKDFHKLSRQLCILLLPPQQMQQFSPLQAQTVWYKNASKKLTSFSEILPRRGMIQYPTIRYET